jgi:ribosomal protein S6--L-glutamate ligase
MSKQTKLIPIGWEEWVSLPELNLLAIKTKVDTGAKTSALHAFMVEKIEEDGQQKIRFGIHPIPERPDIEIYCKAVLVAEREVTSSSGHTELRYVIKTMLQLGDKSWPIEVSLTNRETMSYRMLLGRTALEGKLAVFPQASHLFGELSPQLYDKVSSEPHQRQLKIGLLSREPDSYSTERIVQAARARGHDIRIINTTRCYIKVTSTQSSVQYMGEELEKFDAIIPRIGASITFYGMAVLRQFEAMNTYCLNSSLGIIRSRDKLFAHQILGRGGIGMPVTVFGHVPGDMTELITLVGGAPLVIKLLEGTQGRGVVLAETSKAAQAVIQAFRGLKANFIVQEYIKESAGRDIRCIVLGNKVIAAMERVSQEGDFRSNLHQGGKSFKVKITPEERKTAVKAAKLLGLHFAGVDLLRTESGPKLLEVNSSPGLEGIERTTKKDIAGMVIDYIEQNARPIYSKHILGS